MAALSSLICAALINVEPAVSVGSVGYDGRGTLHAAYAALRAVRNSVMWTARTTVTPTVSAGSLKEDSRRPQRTRSALTRFAKL